jgi:NADH/F420H2 dehydrogenase subunit C
MIQQSTKQVLLNFQKFIQKNFPSVLGYVINGELLIIVPKNKIKKIVLFLKNNTNTQFKALSDISGADYPDKKNRFEVIYNLLSISYNSRITLITYVDELAATDSITSIFECANWFEREVWDMYGVFFYDNTDLRRILTDYGFKGYPLRKDFPLIGYVEVRYDELQKRVITEKVSLAQDYRDFSFNNNWIN